MREGVGGKVLGDSWEALLGVGLGSLGKFREGCGMGFGKGFGKVFGWLGAWGGLIRRGWG